MPKGGGKKKKGKKKKKEKKIDPNALTEVDKTFYELTITDLNRKLARLRSLTAELEEKNEQLQTELTTLDEDRNDIIVFLKRMLQERSKEIAELQERLRALEETRQDETEHYEEKIADLENEYKQMHEHLTSEIKLLEGKLNSLEEFRIQRDDLLKKFENQENLLEDQERRHKNELYEIERKFIIGKDKLKKDMEARLLQLSSEFQEATEVRIAATTHRVIRENIAINNELDEMLITQDKLYKENVRMKERDKTLRQEKELHEAEKKKTLAKARVQMKIIERFTKDHEEMVEKLAKYETIERDMHDANVELQDSKQTIVCLNHKIRILEQNLHAVRCKETSIRTELNNIQDDNDRLKMILGEAVVAINEVLEAKSTISDESLRSSKRESLLTQIFILLSEAEKKSMRKASLETVPSLSATYETGDLGFVPKSVTGRVSIPTLRHIEAQTGQSFEEFLAIGKSVEIIQKPEQSIELSVEEVQSSETSVFEEQSDVFFDEEEEVLEESSLEDFDDFDDYGDDSDKRTEATESKASGKSSVKEGVTSKKESSTKVSTKESKSSKKSSTAKISQKEGADEEPKVEGRRSSKEGTKSSKESLSKESKEEGRRTSKQSTKGSKASVTEKSSKEKTDEAGGDETTAETSPLPDDTSE